MIAISGLLDKMIYNLPVSFRLFALTYLFLVNILIKETALAAASFLPYYLSPSQDRIISCPLLHVP